MATVFGVPWADLTPEILQAFLAEAGGEPLRWEAKADDEKGRLRAETALLVVGLRLPAQRLTSCFGQEGLKDLGRQISPWNSEYGRHGGQPTRYRPWSKPPRSTVRS